MAAWLLFMLFFMVLAVLIVTFLDSTFLAVPDLSSLLCLLTCDGDPNGDPEGSNPRDIRVRAKGEGLWRISDAHCAYDPLHFVLFHPHGEPDWHPNIIGLPLRLWMG